MRLAFLSAGLGALGLICLLVGLVGTTQRTVMIQDTGASWEQPPAFIRSKPAPGQPRSVRGAAFEVHPDSPAPPRKIVHNVIPEQILKAFSATNRPQTRGLAAKQTAEFGLKPIKRAQGQKLHMDFNGETPIGDDDFDAAGYNMEGVWDWKLGKFRSPKFVHLPEIEAYESPDGEKLEVPDCTPDDSLPKVTLYDDCGSWPRWEASLIPYRDLYLRYYNQNWWCDSRPWTWYWGSDWCDRWKGYVWDFHEQEMPEGGSHELPMGFYSDMGDKCYDDRPLNIVKDRTRTEAAWQGGCMLPGCIPPDSGSALSLPDGVNVVLYDEFDFKGDHVSINGPVEIPCLALYDADGCRPRGGLWVDGNCYWGDSQQKFLGWNDRIGSIKVQNSIGLDAEEPKDPDRIHDTNWIYPGGPDSSISKYDPYFNQWDELDSSEYAWHKPPERITGPDFDFTKPEQWQADVNNLY